MEISRSDLRLFQKAIESRWKFNPSLKSAMLTRLSRIIADSTSSDRMVIACARVLVAMEKQNQDDEHKFVDVSIQQRNYRVDAIARELGIDPSIIGYDEGQANVDIVSDEEL